MQKWRYHSLIMRDLAIADAKLNAEGEKGWELVSVCLVDSNTARAFFRMPVAEATADRPETAIVADNSPFDLSPTGGQ